VDKKWTYEYVNFVDCIIFDFWYYCEFNGNENNDNTITYANASMQECFNAGIKKWGRK